MIEAVLKAFAAGRAVGEVPGLAPQARNDYVHGPAPELAALRSIAFVAANDLGRRGIERHGAPVATILYYRVEGGPPRFVMVHLTPNGLITDQDVVAD